MLLETIVEVSTGQKGHGAKNTPYFPDIEHNSIVLSEWKELTNLISGTSKENTISVNGHSLLVAHVVAVAR